MVSKNIENLYNTYLVISRSSQNKPFKLRKDFSDFYETEQFVLTKKIERFLLQHPEISPEIYFKAPYALHPDQCFDLSFYASLKGVKAYTTYLKSLENLSLDHEYHLKDAAKSLQYIKSFCINHKIKKLNEYIHYTSNDLYPDWLHHIKNRQVSKYIMFGFNNTRTVLESIQQQDIIQMLVPDLFENYYSYFSKFNNSYKMKALVNRGLKLLQQQINIS